MQVCARKGVVHLQGEIVAKISRETGAIIYNQGFLASKGVPQAAVEEAAAELRRHREWVLQDQLGRVAPLRDKGQWSSESKGFSWAPGREDDLYI